MGYVCQGWPLRSDHPFFIQRIVDRQQATSGPSFQAHDQVADEDDEYFDSEDEDEGFVDGDGDGDIDADGDVDMDMDGGNEWGHWLFDYVFLGYIGCTYECTPVLHGVTYHVPLAG